MPPRWSRSSSRTRAAGLRDSGQLVTDLICREPARERLPENTSGSLDLDQVALARTADCSVLGRMNDTAFIREMHRRVRRHGPTPA
jgi:hypothetical protein